MNSRELLSHLVSFDTTSTSSNLQLIEFVQDYLAEQDVTSQLVHDKSRKKANLYATIGPLNKSGVMLSGHTDVVPVSGQSWSSDPFVLTQRDDHLFGRGSCDMKGFIASALAIIPRLTQLKLHTPVHLALSYDEEVGCLGVRRLIAMMDGLAVRPGMAIIGEPTSMDLIIAHKGKQAIRVNVEGVNCHSAYPTEGVNAVEYSAALVAEIRRIHAQFKTEGPFDHDYRVPHTTLHVGLINGGTALNIVPHHCQFDFEIRHLPDDDPEQITGRIRDYAEHVLLAEMKSGGLGGNIHFTQISAYPGLYTAPDAEVVGFVRELLDHNTVPGKISFGTEGGLFSQQLGIPTIVCGPGSIQQAHKADEYVSVNQLNRCDHMMENLLLAVRA